jgi:hypothetical protein
VVEEHIPKAWRISQIRDPSIASSFTTIKAQAKVLA